MADVTSWGEIKSAARTYQYDRYIAATLAPRKNLHELILLAAFAADIDRILVSINEPAMIAIRLQWWCDAIDTPEKYMTGSPLADKLRSVIFRLKLPSNQFTQYIEAQDIELYPDLLPDLAALKKHFINRDGILFKLAAIVLGIKFNDQIQATIEAGAQAYGLALTLAQLPIRLQSRQLLLPADLAAKHGVYLGKKFDVVSVKRVRYELAQAAYTSLSEYRRLVLKSSHNISAAMLPIALTDIYIEAAFKHNYTTEKVKFEPLRFRRAWLMLRAKWRGFI
ncbi:MAG: squalene/phytoene synthase family protein [Hyphomicrobiaceae bacterium]|nr:squalene/phytoene synthase family protein [Hyphomicrobiaceae bacterium]